MSGRAHHRTNTKLAREAEQLFQRGRRPWKRPDKQNRPPEAGRRLVCTRCGHAWVGRRRTRPTRPLRCPKCSQREPQEAQEPQEETTP